MNKGFMNAGTLGDIMNNDVAALSGCVTLPTVKPIYQTIITPENKQVNIENGKYHPKNKLNDLTGKEWLFFTKTVLRTSYPHEYGHKLRKKHFANKPPQLMKHLIEFFTKSGQSVLDPFAGVGGTLLGASLCNRKATGIEVNQEWIDVYSEVCDEEKIEKQQMMYGDCLQVMSELKDKEIKFDAVITDPPYSPALKKTICDEKYGWANRKSNFNSFSNGDKDFRNCQSFEEYYEAIKKAGALIYDILKDDKYLVMMIRDSYQNGEYIPASFYVAEKLKEVGFVFKGIKIWYSTGAPIRPYGYPYAYVPNMVHHNILVFQKKRDSSKEN